MADVLNNLATADQYSDALTLGPAFQADEVTVTIANNPALVEYAVGKVGDWRWLDELEIQVPPQTYKVGRVVGARFRSAVAGKPAQILAILAGPADPDFGAGLLLTSQVAGDGTVTPPASAPLATAFGYVDTTVPEWSPGLSAGTGFIDATTARVAALTPFPRKIVAGRVLTGCVIGYSNTTAVLAGGVFQVGIVDSNYNVLAISNDASALLVHSATPIVQRLRVPFSAPYTVPADTDMYLLVYKSTTAGGGGVVPLLAGSTDGPAYSHAAGYPLASIRLSDSNAVKILPSPIAVGYNFAAALANATIAQSTLFCYFGGLYT